VADAQLLSLAGQEPEHAELVDRARGLRWRRLPLLLPARALAFFACAPQLQSVPDASTAISPPGGVIFGPAGECGSSRSSCPASGWSLGTFVMRKVEASCSARASVKNEADSPRSVGAHAPSQNRHSGRERRRRRRFRHHQR
jgi:hypothetical protein